ncbi:hypothetical protein CYMTET_27447 [Cymbomonas tetramitiformis]|uniref:Glutaminase n=1 Tax=Cymbomonas tetramitiformis TaxID=36881 RepID=A0AAE0FQ86_9CHLO|nr:hypothetical protein CYMTET_27447 [Cymbomonas tetramitiformis]
MVAEILASSAEGSRGPQRMTACRSRMLSEQLVCVTSCAGSGSSPDRTVPHLDLEAYGGVCAGARLKESTGVAKVIDAAGAGDLDKLMMLSKCGLFMDQGDYDGRCALHLAAAQGRLLVANFLLGQSANPDIRDRWNTTPMVDAMRGGSLYHLYIAKLLDGAGGTLGPLADTDEGQAFMKVGAAVWQSGPMAGVTHVYSEELRRGDDDRVAHMCLLHLVLLQVVGAERFLQETMLQSSGRFSPSLTNFRGG